MIIESRELEKRAVAHIAELMCAAARTAPKGRGVDNLVTAVVDGADKDRLAAEMRRIAGASGSQFFERDANCIDKAELVVLLLPGRFGTHAELGIALATSENKRILLWSETSAPFDGTSGFCVFYHHPAIERVVCPFEELLDTLKTL